MDPWVFHQIGPTYSGYQAGDGISYATLDVNGDGREDIITDFGEAPSPLKGGLIWWEAPADRVNGTWIANTIDPTSQDVHNIRIADLNGDGTPEIIAFEQDQSTQQRLNIYYNEGGTGQNWLVQTLATTGGQTESIGDITGDGDLDILNARDGVSDGPAPIEVFLNQLSSDGVVAPTITDQPDSAIAGPGQSATFDITATGTRTLTYQWQLNGLDIPGANGSSCTIPNVQASEDGDAYCCIVGNAHGLIPSASVTLHVSSSDSPGPLVNAGSNQTVLLPDLAAALQGSASEASLPSGRSLTVLWSQLSGPQPVTFSDSSDVSTSAAFPGAGTYVLQLQASDGTYTNASQVTVTVASPSAPIDSISGSVLSALDGTGIPGRTVYIDANEDGQLDEGEVSTTTDSAGDFVFENLQPGNYLISQVLPTGSTSADPASNTRAITLTSSQGVSGVVFADLPAPAASGPGLTVTFPRSLPSSIVGGQKGSATIKITNNGTAAATGPQTLTLFASTTGSFSASNVVVTTTSLKTLNLKPRASKTVTVKFNYPTTLPADTYRLLAVPDSSDSVAQASFNIAASSPIVIAPAYTHLAGAFPGKLPATIKSGQSVALTIQVSNSGNQAFSGPLSITVLEAADPDLDQGSTTLAPLSVKTARIAAGRHASYQIKFKAPADLQTGSEYLVAEINGGSPGVSGSLITFG